jgi:NADH dehydrogenase (ubiquinone) 1 alpha subcomplex subunit 2
MKKNNPNIPILIREATGIEPKVWARYGMEFGRIDFSHADMEKAMAKKHPGHCQVHKGRTASRVTLTD